MKILSLAFSVLVGLSPVNENKIHVIKTLPYVEVINPLHKANEHTTVPILMYHDIGEQGEYSPRYTVSSELFRLQLERLHEKGYSLISMDDYVNGNYQYMKRKPCILTFDDSTAGQFRYIKNKVGLRSIDPDCAVGILRDFSSSHPEFGHRAVFFIDFVDKSGRFQVPFCQAGYEKRKLEDLMEMGMEIGNHTQLHTDMKKSNMLDMTNAIMFGRYLIDILGGPEKRYFAFPYGKLPTTQAGMEQIKDISDYAFAAWGGVAPDINTDRFNRYAIPRIEINNDFKNLEAYVK